MKQIDFRVEWRRILSAMLSIVLICGLIPCGILYNTKAASNTVIQYKFTKSAYSTDNSATNPKDTPFLDYLGDRRWAYIADTVSAESSPISLLSADMQIQSKLGEWVALKINVPAAGNYQVSLDYYAKGAGAITKIYYIPLSSESSWTAANIPNYFNDSNLMGEMDMRIGAPASGGAAKIAAISRVMLNAGDYLLVFKAEGNSNGSSYYNMYPKMLTLDNSQLDSVAITVDKELIRAGDSTSANVTGTMTSGSQADINSAEITYSSSNPTVASIDKSSGQITALSAGQTDIAVSVTLLGVTKTSVKTIQVYEDNPVVSVTISGANTVSIGKQYKMILTAKLKNGSTCVISSDAAQFMVIESVPEGTVELQSGGLITGKAVGIAKIRATGTYLEQAFESDILTVAVGEIPDAETNLKFDFRFNAYDGDTLTDARQYTQYTESRSWAYVTDTFTKTSSSGSSIDLLSNCMQIVSSKSEWLALKIKVPTAGRYRAKMSYYGRDRAGIISIYKALLPSNPTKDTITECINESNKVTSLDTYNETAGTYDGTLGDLSFEEAGEYLLILAATDKNTNSGGYYMYPATLELYGYKAPTGALLSLESGLNEIENGKTGQLTCSAVLVDGTIVNAKDAGAIIAYSSEEPDIISVDENGILTAKSLGSAKITVNVTLNGITVSTTKDIQATDYSDIVSISLTGEEKALVGGTLQLTQEAHLADGNTIPVPANTMTYTVVSCEPEGAATLSESGLITGVSQGVIKVKATSDFRGSNKETQVFSISIEYSLKTKPTIYTQEMRDNARENAKTYAWADSLVKNVIKNADKYVDKANILWNLTVAEGLPRFYYISNLNDPDKWKCRYCGTDLLSKYASFGWLSNPLSDPWKIQCPECKRRFPSNDFGSYYKSGLDEHGIFKPELADRSLLVNQLYPEKGEGWGVDDGFGYFPGHVYPNGVVERHSYISYYIHLGLWRISGKNPGVLQDAVNNLSLAYVYTGEAKYGRTGAILLDRIADLYPGFDWYQWHEFRGDQYRGKIMDPVQECTISLALAKAYDAFYPIYDDPQVISFLSQKAKQYKMSNPKNSAAAIRVNAENGILREIYKACRKGSIGGNFGLTQASITAAAIALDTMPETKEWLDWMMQPGKLENTGDPTDYDRPGGDVLNTLVNSVDRDGMGTEGSSKYNMIWVRDMLDVSEMLHNYTLNSSIDLNSNPKFLKMFTAQIPIIMASYYTAQIGDTGETAGNDFILDKDTAMLGFKSACNPQLAQYLYLLNGNSINGMHGDITEKNPEQIQQDILDVINKYGIFDLKSTMMTGNFGFVALRDGAKYLSSGVEKGYDNQRDFWMHFGRTMNHGHSDCLNLGIDAYGLNMAPDLGYPAQTGIQPNRMQWVDTTLSHNTVVVDGRGQKLITNNCIPLHFDDSNIVKVMDINGKKAYSQADIYRRTVVMVKANDDVAYGVDFFRIRGGNDHLYSFHSQSDEIFETEGLSLKPQTDSDGNYIGTYAGSDVPWGEDPNTDPDNFVESDLKYPTGFTWLDSVRRDSAPQKTFAVDFKVKDFRNILDKTQNLHLRVTMLNDFNLSEVAIAHGTPPQNAYNLKYIKYLEYLLARRTGTNLDTLFTTVYEPYNGTRYLESMTTVNAEILEGTQGETDTVKAVTVTHKDGRIDYVVYATNNTVKYRIDDLFDFRGFVGVYTIKDSMPIYSYLNDGDIIGGSTRNLSAVTGVVEDFTKDLQIDNCIAVNTNQQIDPSVLIGKYVFVENGGATGNGVYKIIGASTVSGNKLKLNIGDVSVIRAFKDQNDMSLGYLYNIAKGQTFRIPLQAVNDGSPIFVPIEKKMVDAKSGIRFIVSAKSPIDKELTFRAVTLPRGASFNTETHEFIWTPDSKQIGTNHVAIEATDGALSSTLHIEIDVLSATSGGKSNGANGAGEEGAVKPPSGEVQQIEPVKPEIASNDKFVDLNGYDWAKDAIDSLVNAGIINGTSENTFSPGNNITRADFTILLVRAFNIKSDSTDNFADVSSDAYYAGAIAAAKGSGIISGIGNNNYNPTAPISRQDLMVIIKRVLEKTSGKLEKADDSVLTGFIDAEDISDYAKSAVAVLVKTGIIMGTENRINPKGYATRAEVAVMINGIINEKN